MTAGRATVLILGQSNAANHGPVRADGGPGARVFHEGSFLPARDPLPGASGNGGSVWTRFAPKAIGRGLCSEIVLLNLAQGGTAISDWAPGGGHHFRLVTALDKVADSGMEFTHVVWHQGERDTLMDTSEAVYAARLSDLISDIRARGMAAPIIVCRATCRVGRTNAGVSAAQAAVVDPRAGIFAGPDTDMLGGEYRYDDTHLDSRGQELFADMLVAAFAAADGRPSSASAAG